MFKTQPNINFNSKKIQDRIEYLMLYINEFLTKDELKTYCNIEKESPYIKDSQAHIDFYIKLNDIEKLAVICDIDGNGNTFKSNVHYYIAGEFSRIKNILNSTNYDYNIYSHINQDL